MIIDTSEPLVETGMIGSSAPSVDVKAVYVVDDDSMVRRSLSLSLSTAGFFVRPFASGHDFLEQAETLDPGCVLLDVRMPGLDGIGVLTELLVRTHQLAIVTMTGHGDIETAVKAMKTGSTDFIQKPFTDADLLDIIDTAISGLQVRLAVECKRSIATRRLDALSMRERDVLQGLIGGLTNKELATRLCISVRTVEMHRGRLMTRLKVKTVAEAVRVAILAGLEPL